MLDEVNTDMPVGEPGSEGRWEKFYEINSQCGDHGIGLYELVGDSITLSDGRKLPHRVGITFTLDRDGVFSEGDSISVQMLGGESKDITFRVSELSFYISSDEHDLQIPIPCKSSLKNLLGGEGYAVAAKSRLDMGFAVLDLYSDSDVYPTKFKVG